MKVYLGTREAFVPKGPVPQVIVAFDKTGWTYDHQTKDDVPSYRPVILSFEEGKTEEDQKAELRARLDAAKRARAEADTEAITAKKALEALGEVEPEKAAPPAPATPAVKPHGVGFKRIG